MAVALPRVVDRTNRPLVRKLLHRANQAAWALVCALILAVGALGIYTHSGHGAVTPVLTGSMRPGIQPGDAVVTTRVPVSSLHKGEIIVFRPPGATLARVHRIYTLQKVQGGIAITTKGDANNTTDPWGRIVLKGSAYKVRAVIPKIGWLVDGGLRWIITGLVFMFAVAIGRMTWKYVRS